jgi:hypothetical protein
MHVKVVYESVKFIVPFKVSPKMSISKLSQIITQKYMSEFGATKFKIVELRTLDGFLLSMDDQVEDIINNGDILQISNSENYLKANLPLCSLDWYLIERNDLKDKLAKTICVGKHQYNKVSEFFLTFLVVY